MDPDDFAAELKRREAVLPGIPFPFSDFYRVDRMCETAASLSMDPDDFAAELKRREAVTSCTFSVNVLHILSKFPKRGRGSGQTFAVERKRREAVCPESRPRFGHFDRM